MGPVELVVGGLEGGLGVLRYGPELLRVERRHVVVLLEGVDEDLPVAGVLGPEGIALGHQVERVALERADHRPEELPQRLARLSARFTKMKPAHTSQWTGARPSVGLVEVEELVLLVHICAATVEAVAPAVVLADELAADAAGLLARRPAHTNLFPRWRHTLWNARTSPSMSRTTSTEVPAATRSFVNQLPSRGRSSIRPTFSHARRKIASRSSS